MTTPTATNMMKDWENLTYLNGFGNEFESEAPGFEGALPRGLINPQKPAFGLYAEQLSGSAFTAPRASNKRSWLYRKLPSVRHLPYGPLADDNHHLDYDGHTDPNQMRWKPFEHINHEKEGDSNRSFLEYLRPLAYSDQEGSAVTSVTVHIYAVGPEIELAGRQRSCVNSDGDFLIVPQEGTLLIMTEFGRMVVEPNEIAVIQQGMVFAIYAANKGAPIRGYVLEVKGNHFELPNLGPIGANGLANPRDFQIPTAWVDTSEPTEFVLYFMVRKFRNKLFQANLYSSAFNVAAWFGNYTPYKYSLDKFVTINSVSVDHPDPSIFTVLTCPLIGKPGTALADFVIFPPRWECATNTFRPPYYHRNCMTEFMGLIKGQYQAKSGKFAPGGGSLHQAMMPHGPDAECFEMATSQDTSQPKRVADNTMAFMFETSLTLDPSAWALNENIDEDYCKCWLDLKVQQ